MYSICYECALYDLVILTAIVFYSHDYCPFILKAMHSMFTFLSVWRISLSKNCVNQFTQMLHARLKNVRKIYFLIWTWYTKKVLRGERKKRSANFHSSWHKETDKRVFLPEGLQLLRAWLCLPIAHFWLPTHLSPTHLSPHPPSQSQTTCWEAWAVDVRWVAAVTQSHVIGLSQWMELTWEIC